MTLMPEPGRHNKENYQLTPLMYTNTKTLNEILAN